MSKLIAFLFLLIGGFTWLFQKSRNRRNAGSSKKVIKGLKSGQFSVSSFSESLGMNIRSKSLTGEMNPLNIGQRISSISGKKLLEKFDILHAQADERHRVVVIAEATIKDTIPLYTRDKEVAVLYPCWIYIELMQDENKISFRSSMPSDKDHQFLLEDLSDELYRLCYQ